MNAIVPATEAGSIMESVLIKGDLSKLTPDERVRYYGEVCKSIGLNPLTQPLEYINLNGKLRLYAKRDAADQLRKINGISLMVASKEQVGDLFVVEVEAKDKTGRCDADMGAVSIKGLSGEMLANAMLKAVTKAKRRATLSISGLGFLDESEVESVAPMQQTAQPQTVAQIAPPKQDDPANHPYELVLSDGEILTFARGSQYLAAFERAFNADTNKDIFWENNQEHFQSWQTRTVQAAEKDARHKPAKDEFCRVGKIVMEALAPNSGESVGDQVEF